MLYQSARRASFIYVVFSLLALAVQAPAPACPPSPSAPASRLLYLGPIAGEYSEDVTVGARLIDEGAAAVQGRTISFSLAGGRRNAATAADGTDDPTSPA